MTIIIAGFPGVGKTTAYNELNGNGITIADSDSSSFSKSLDFPNNYFEHIKSLMGSVDVVMTSTHESVLDLLKENNMPYVAVVPPSGAKFEYLERYSMRGNGIDFIIGINNNWDKWINHIQKNYNYFSLDTYLTLDIIKFLQYTIDNPTTD